MFFRKSVNEKIDDIATKIRVSPDEFSDIPDSNCRIALDRLGYDNGRPVSLNFAETQLLTRKLSKDCGINVRLPTLKRIILHIN